MYRHKLGSRLETASRRFGMAISFHSVPSSTKIILLSLMVVTAYVTLSTHSMEKFETRDFNTACIVLGEMLVRGKASQNLISRIQATQDSVEEFMVSHIIFSGGDTAQVNKTEATVMDQLWEQSFYKFEKSRSIPKTHLEEHSLSTCQNAFFSIPILRKIKADRIVIVTSDYHVPRAKLLFEQVFSTDAVELLRAELLTFVAPTTRNDARTRLFENERFWLQSNPLKRLLTNMTDHPFHLPSLARIEWARQELNNIEQQYS
jgi:uncharacterized SAM-binding protein YcdF (DUF218 family)